MTPEESRALATLAQGIIPADEFDAGAGAVDAAERLAQRIDAGVNAKVYLDGLRRAEAMARQRFSATVESLAPGEVHELIGALRAEAPGLFKQLRMDVCALYLADPLVWERIGFPGPSTETGGYPDFDRPQRRSNHP
jgi:hypothetical protein